MPNRESTPTVSPTNWNVPNILTIARIVFYNGLISMTVKRNSVLFYVLASLAIILCVAGLVRYDRNEEKAIYLPPQPASVMTANPSWQQDTIEIKPYFHSDFNEAVATAQQQKKPLLLLFTAKNCIFSKQVLDTTFQSDVINPFLQRFILVNIDINEQKEISRRLNIDSTPTIQFLSTEGIPLQRVNGAAKPEDLIAQMNSTLHTIASHGRIVVR
jgi:thiol:disulfide interchange protein